MPSWHLIIDLEKCENCNNCFLACKDEHVDNQWPGYSEAQPRHGQRWMNIFRKERGQYPLIDVAYRPTPCMHCDDAPCMQAASPGEIEKRPDGIVLIHPEKARGNKKLVRACPYDAIYWNDEKQVAQKCTGCAHLLDDGWKQPRCTQVCPTGALRFVDAGTEESHGRLNGEGMAVLHPEYNSKPRVYYKNMHRFDKCFIAGSIACQRNHKSECAAGAKVKLTSNQTSTREVIADMFGDFKFDGLESESGTYRIEISYPPHPTRTVDVDLGDSTNIGVVLLS
jgi:Fe-S-cluster-containing dehydrogenase component